ncbi:N-acetyl-gamma-glutamyl-phosphate reductase [Marivirga sp. S37H4]|uniref:N-acetyl-gamma-glutamyl-phosphate reductase n=1 Tax=Marivirga aurantiaca TaxID=2802615 RepID=A0A934WXW4_9BACT|nr:N-acetyl-gamma-glutamyl-phosphate reductase [Marivirga aurantiaca]MBK6264921.1 N-acetyl-gamma-glutamyl-phosphate reductase [Marivirga aurantiaca]
MIKAGIIGAAGYTGGELIRILLNHAEVEIAFAVSGSQAGKNISAVHPDLLGETDLKFVKDFHSDIDVLFLCAGHGAAKDFLKQNKLAEHIKVIDLSQDFRLGESIQGREFIYGLPELFKSAIQQANNIANPGCFATAIQLGLLPMVKQALVNDELHISGITGSTGAGVSLSETSHFSWRVNNISTYKTFEHQHLKEIKHNFRKLSNQVPNILFVPYRGPFTRGIWITSYFKRDLGIDEATEIYQNFYQDQPFTHVTQQELDLKQVVNTNKCFIRLEKKGEHLIVSSIIDNLIKGASGQAVQNMNLMFGFDESTGLKLKATGF